jgi:hypothetical protein
MRFLAQHLLAAWTKEACRRGPRCQRGARYRGVAQRSPVWSSSTEGTSPGEGTRRGRWRGRMTWAGAVRPRAGSVPEQRRKRANRAGDTGGGSTGKTQSERATYTRSVWTLDGQTTYKQRYRTYKALRVKLAFSFAFSWSWWTNIGLDAFWGNSSRGEMHVYDSDDPGQQIK